MKSPATPLLIVVVALYIFARAILQLTLFTYHLAIVAYRSLAIRFSSAIVISFPLTSGIVPSYHLSKAGFAPAPKPKQRKPTKARKSKAGDRICE